MIGTRQSGERLPGLHVGGRRRTALLVAAELILTWALVVLVGWLGLVGLIAAAVTAWLNRVVEDDAARAEHRIIGTALREHTDPGPDYRLAVDGEAARRLAANVVDRWGAEVVAVLLAGTCVVVALLRDDAGIALPAAPLVVLAAVLDAVRRRGEAVAERWIADPPAPHGEATGP
jgi:hypothetical protein